MESIYMRQWDEYVREWTPEDGQVWPGDEWGDPEIWESNFRRYFLGAGEWEKAVEIGPGSGKYTQRVLRENPGLDLRAYDVSPKFLEVCKQRCPTVDTRVIDTSTPGFLLRDLEDWKREVDAVYSIGVFVHIDLQYLIAYLLTIGSVLRPGGRLIASFSNVNSEAGFYALLDRLRGHWKGQWEPTDKYEWVSPDLVKTLLPRLGFEINLMDSPDELINSTVVARLVQPDKAEAAVSVLTR